MFKNIKVKIGETCDKLERVDKACGVVLDWLAIGLIIYLIVCYVLDELLFYNCLEGHWFGWFYFNFCLGLRHCIGFVKDFFKTVF